MENEELIKNVMMAFSEFAKNCEYAEAPQFWKNVIDGDCYHPFSDKRCTPRNCPFFLEDE